MATAAAEIEFIPDEQVEFIPDAAPAQGAIEFIPDVAPEVVEQEARRATAGALQTLDVMAAPTRLDWSEVNEHLDQQRFQEAEIARARAEVAEQQGSGTGPGSEAFNWRREAEFQLGRISPDTSVGRRLAQEGQAQLQAIEQEDESAARVRTPSEVISGILGPGLSPTVMPTVEATGRNLGSATGGAAGAALATVATAGTGGILPLFLGMGSSLLGSYMGGAAQEGILRTTETEEETQQRHQHTSEAVAQNPSANLLGGMLATRPFFGPSLATFGRAAAGDRGALMNIGLGGSLGAAGEVVGAAMRGETAKAKDIAAAFFSNAVMNEPTKLGRKMGLLPSTEQQAFEEAQAKYREIPPMEIASGPELQSGLGTRGTTSTVDVFENVPRRTTPTGEPNALNQQEAGTSDGGVRPPEVTSEDVPLPAAESGEGVQPSGQGERLAQATPEAPREVTYPEGWKFIVEDNTVGKSTVRRAKILGPEGETHYTADLANEPGGFVTLTGVANLSRKSRGLGSKFYQDIADEVAKSGQRLIVGINSTPSAKTLHQKMLSEGALRPLSKDDLPFGIPEDSVPFEVIPRRSSTSEKTSIQNAITAEERAARGIDPVEEPARRAFGEVWDTVKAEIAESPTSPDTLLAELRKKPRALTDREDALILHRQIELQKAFDSAAAEVNRAAEAGDEPARVEAMAQLNRTRDALQDVYDIGKQAGTETARGLAARKMMADQEFTLAAMETRLRAEQGGALSPEQQAKVKEQADTIARTQEGMDRILAEREAAKAEAAEDAKIDPKVKSLADRIVARLDLASKNAAKSLRSRLANMGSAPDPLIVLDVAKIAAARTAKGAIEFAQWSAEMVKEFGEKIRPFLQAGWDRREQLIDGEVGTAVRGNKRMERTAAEKEAAAVKARLTALANRTAKLQERTGAGDFSPMRKPPMDLSKNPEWVKLKAENDAAKADYEKARYEARKAQRSTQQKITDTVADVWAASRPILASTDISAPGRQGIFFSLPDLFTNPVRLGRQLKTMFRSQFSETKFQQNEAAIKSRDNADLYEDSGLYLADIDHKPSAREEQFKSELAEKIPGIGRVVRGSARGFSAFMNTVRADAMDAFVKWSGGKENVDPETAKFLAAAINDLTGRGNVSSRQTQGALEWLAKYLFSPRLWVSRFNTAILRPIWRKPFNREIAPRARAVVAVQYLKFAGALLALKWIAGLNGAKMEEDPRDSDFGKLQVGSKRYDVMGGIGNMVTLLARLWTQETKDDKGKVLKLAWRGEKRPERELGQVLFNHLRNKAAPIPGAIYDYIYGRHPDRSKVTPTSMLKQTTVPITVSDTVEFFQRDNPAAAARDTLINALGVSVQDYQ